MNLVTQRLSWLLMMLSLGLGSAASAQDTARPATADPSTSPVATGASAAKPAPKSTAQIDAGEPRANTAQSTAQAAPAASSGPAPPAAASPAGSIARAKASAAGKAPGATDRLELGTATVTGDREQPKVMYIVPWKRSDIGDLSGKPMNSLLDEALAPVDRDEFKREVAYFDVVKADTSRNGATNPAANQVEK